MTRALADTFGALASALRLPVHTVVFLYAWMTFGVLLSSLAGS